MSLLHITNLRKSYTGQLVLDTQLPQLERGQITLLRGDNGAGKTTLLRILASLLTPDSLTLKWNGTACAALRPGKDVTYLQQQPLLLQRSVRDNINYALHLHQEARPSVAQILQWAGLTDLAERLPNELSMGQLRRAAIARTYATAAPLVLLDEPTVNLDIDGISKVWQLIAALVRDQRSVIVAGSDNAPKDLLIGQYWQLRDGKVQASQPAMIDHE